MLTLPPGLTEEEEALQKRFAKLRKKKKALLALKKQQSNTGPSSQGGIKRSMSDQPPVDTATATEQAKLLVKSGAISAIKAETKNSGFKRSRTLEGKLKDPEKGPAPTFQPFQRSVSADDDTPESRRPQRKSLYESPELLRSAFAPFGAIIDLSLDSPRNCAFVTYEKMESADQAMAELNGAVVQDVQLRVSIARKQPLLDAATGKSLWGSLAVKNSAKGSHRDKRAQVVYNEDLFGGQ
uniref:Negative elongation factor E n=1 Tax=Pavo cristatus TaxID=9049 RepID=A0A8C9EI84_PAVCR